MCENTFLFPQNVHTRAHHMESTSVGVGPVQGHSTVHADRLSHCQDLLLNTKNLGIKILALQVVNCLLICVSVLLSVPSIQLYRPVI